MTKPCRGAGAFHKPGFLKGSRHPDRAFQAAEATLRAPTPRVSSRKDARAPRGVRPSRSGEGADPLPGAGVAPAPVVVRGGCPVAGALRRLPAVPPSHRAPKTRRLPARVPA
jgi:hypothetical protein